MKTLYYLCLAFVLFTNCQKDAASDMTISVVRPTDNQVINFGGSISKQYWITAEVSSSRKLQSVVVTITNASNVVISSFTEADFGGGNSYSYETNHYMTAGTTTQDLTLTITATDDKGHTHIKTVKYKLIA